jgi:hypothetical protein
MNRQRRKRAEKAEARSFETGLQAPSRGNPVKHTGRPQGGPRGRHPRRIDLYDKGAH